VRDQSHTSGASLDDALRDQLDSCYASASCPAELAAAASTMEGGLAPDSSAEMQGLFGCIVDVLRSETVGSGAIGG
jgi:hypothetical protein